jgi:hypothetical protein
VKYAFDSKSKIIKMEELIMLCPKCGKEMKKGYLFASKDGAFSFAEKVPGAFENARNAEGFVQITELKAGHRTSVAANCCEDCRMVVLNY